VEGSFSSATPARSDKTEENNANQAPGRRAEARPCPRGRLAPAETSRLRASRPPGFVVSRRRSARRSLRLASTAEDDAEKVELTFNYSARLQRVERRPFEALITSH